MTGGRPRRAAALALLAAITAIPPSPAASTAAPADGGFEPVGTARLVSRTPGGVDVALSRHAAVVAYTVETAAGGEDIRMRVRGQRGDILVSWPLDGESQDELSSRPEISADGRYVVYDSYATNLAPGDHNVQRDSFLYDATTGVNTLVTRHPETGEAVGGDEPRISTDGRFVTFHTSASLVPEDLNRVVDAYRYEIGTGAIELVSRALSGSAGNDNSFPQAISGNGNLVAFTSYATDLVEDPPADFFPQLYVADLTTGDVRRVSESPEGEPADSWTYEASFDRIGRYLAFASSASNLAPEFSGGVVGIFRADLVEGEIELISQDMTGAAPDDNSWLGAVSGNGRFVTFFSEAADLVPYDTVDGYDVFLYDTSYDVTYLLSHGHDGAMADGSSFRPAIGASSRFVAFASRGSNIVPGDDNGKPDVFLYRINRVGLR